MISWARLGEYSLTIRPVETLALAASLAVALALAGCGRAGPLDLPPSAVAPPPAPAVLAQPPAGSADPNAQLVASQNSAMKAGFDAKGNPVAAQSPRKDFPLDFLLQ
jgi:predicted small lipoprotein YifL